LNAAILKVCPNYLFDDLMLIYLIENSDFNYENFITNSILNKLKLRVKKADAAIKVEFKGLKLSVLKLNIPELKAKVVTSNSKQSSNKNLKVATLNKFFVLPFNVKKKTKLKSFAIRRLYDFLFRNLYFQFVGIKKLKNKKKKKKIIMCCLKKNRVKYM